jgi:Fe-S cluster assembly scaffold protein SufB
MYQIDEQLRRRAEKAMDKKSPYGEDIGFSRYVRGLLQQKDVGGLLLDERETLTEAGFDVEDANRAASFLQIDHSIGRCNIGQEGVELMPTRDALEKYYGLPEYWWQAVPVDADKYTAKVALDFDNGYFIRALPGTRSFFPVQTCMFMSTEKVDQNVHNVIVVEEGAHLEIISGCATAHQIQEGLHLGVTEFYIKKNAHLSFTMIHNWAEDVLARPRSVAFVEEGGVFVSKYICMKRLASLQLYPTAYLRGCGATARFNSVVAAPAGSNIDIGSRVVLSHPECKAEIVSRAVSFGGNIIARGHLTGAAPGVKAHLECHGLMLSKQGLIHAIPELEGRVAGVEMSHEAAVGKIAQEEVEYLMARGLTEEDAVSTIVRGFLNVAISGLPSNLQKDLDALMAKSNEVGM